jgi:hypothetical protein
MKQGNSYEILKHDQQLYKKIIKETDNCKNYRCCVCNDLIIYTAKTRKQLKYLFTSKNIKRVLPMSDKVTCFKCINKFNECRMQTKKNFNKNKEVVVCMSGELTNLKELLKNKKREIDQINTTKEGFLEVMLKR